MLPAFSNPLSAQKFLTRALERVQTQFKTLFNSRHVIYYFTIISQNQYRKVQMNVSYAGINIIDNATGGLWNNLANSF